MTAFATVEDLATYVQRDFDAADTATAELVLDLVSAAIRDYTGQTISLVEDDTITVDPPSGYRLFLPELPVTEVSSLTVNGTLYAVNTDYAWYGDTGMIRLAHRWWGTLANSVVIVYSHGYATIPEAVRWVTLATAGRALENPLGLTRQDIGDNGEAADAEGNAVFTYRNPLAVGTTIPMPEFTAEEKSLLDRYRPLVVV